MLPVIRSCGPAFETATAAPVPVACTVIVLEQSAPVIEHGATPLKTPAVRTSALSRVSVHLPRVTLSTVRISSRPVA